MADKKISALTAASTPLAGTEVLPIVQSGATVKVSAANITAGRAVSMASLSAVGNGAAGTQTLATFNAAADAFSNSVELALEPLISGQTSTCIGAQREGVGTGAAVYLKAGGNEVLRGTVAGNISVATGNVVMATAGKGIDFSANTHAAGMTSELLNWFETGTWSPSLFDSAGNPLTLGTAVGRYTRVGNAVTVTCAVSWTALGSAGATPLILAGLPFAAANVAGLNQSAALGFIDGIDTVLGTKQITANLPLNTSYFTFKQTNDNAAPTDLAANSCSATGEIRLSTTYIV